jgi:hypothetical protein
MESIVAIGCGSVNGELIVDCWRLTNFPEIEAENFSERGNSVKRRGVMCIEITSTLL